MYENPQTKNNHKPREWGAGEGENTTKSTATSTTQSPNRTPEAQHKAQHIAQSTEIDLNPTRNLSLIHIPNPRDRQKTRMPSYA